MYKQYLLSILHIEMVIQLNLCEMVTFGPESFGHYIKVVFIEKNLHKVASSILVAIRK